MGTSSEDSLALVRQVCDIGELMAVELKDGTESLLLVPLTVEALLDVVHILVQNVNLCLVVQSALSIVSNLGTVCTDFDGVSFIVVLSLSDSLCELENLKSESLDGDNLVGVDVDLLLVAILVREWRVKVVAMDGVVVVLGNDRAVVATLSLGLGLGSCLGGDFSSSIGAQAEGLGGESNGCKSGKEFHNRCKFILYSKSEFRAHILLLILTAFLRSNRNLLSTTTK